MDFKTKLMLSKAEGIVRHQAGRGDFKPEEIEKVIKTTKEAINNKKIKRLEDLKNFIHAELEKVSKAKGHGF